ncbi:MAG: hypothetical protein ACREA2_19970 [Blastocatellia bacterium]
MSHRDSEVGFRTSAGVPRLSKRLYLGTAAVMLGLSVMMPIAAWSTTSEQARFSPLSSLLAPEFLLAVIYAAIIMTLVYKMWASIQDGYARTSPGKALGFMFIPLFNLYWVFQVFPGFAQDFNTFASRHSINAPHLPTSLFTTYAILCLLAIFPIICLLLIPINFFVGLIVISKICDAVNSIPEKLPDQEVWGTAFQAP